MTATNQYPATLEPSDREAYRWFLSGIPLNEIPAGILKPSLAATRQRIFNAAGVTSRAQLQSLHIDPALRLANSTIPPYPGLDRWLRPDLLAAISRRNRDLVLLLSALASSGEFPREYAYLVSEIGQDAPEGPNADLSTWALSRLYNRIPGDPPENDPLTRCTRTWPAATVKATAAVIATGSRSAAADVLVMERSSISRVLPEADELRRLLAAAIAEHPHKAKSFSLLT